MLRRNPGERAWSIALRIALRSAGTSITLAACSRPCCRIPTFTAGTSNDVLLRLNREAKRALAQPDAQQRFADLGMDNEYRTPEELDAFIGRMESDMREAAKRFEFEKAAKLRDHIKELRTKEFLFA